jgi:phosphatidylglycerophosphate synthase
MDSSGSSTSVVSRRFNGSVSRQLTPMAILGGTTTILAGLYAGGSPLFTVRVLPIWLVFSGSLAWVYASHRLTDVLRTNWRAYRRDRSRPAPGGWDELTQRRNRLLPNLLTATRPSLGLAAAVLLSQGDIVSAFWVFFVGQVSDLLDGMLARELTTERSDYGERFDAIADLIFHFFTTVGLVIYAVQFDHAWILIIVGIGFATWILPRLGLFEPGSVYAKGLSGLIRGVLIAVMLLLLPPESRTPALFATGYFVTIGLWYQFHITGRELRDGQRPMRRWDELSRSSPPPPGHDA